MGVVIISPLSSGDLQRRVKFLVDSSLMVIFITYGRINYMPIFWTVRESIKDFFKKSFDNNSCT